MEKERNEFNLFSNQLPVPYMSLDENGNILEVNHAWLKTLGWKRKYVIGKNFTDFLTPESREKFRNSFRKFKAAGEIKNITFDVLKKDSSLITVLFNGRIERIVQDGSIRTHCVITDVVKSRLKNAKIERLNRVLKSMSVVNRYMIRERDEKSLIRAICNHLTSANSYDRAWIVLFDKNGKVRLSAESGLRGDFGEFLKALEEKKSIPCMDKVLKSEDVVISTEMWKNCSGCPLAPKNKTNMAGLSMKLSSRGKTYGILTACVPSDYLGYEEEFLLFEGVANDTAFILHEIETEKDVRAGEAFNKSIVENSPDCINVLNTNGRLDYMSEYCQKLMAIEDISRYIGKDWRNFWKGEDYEKAVKAVADASKGKTGKFTGYCPTEKGTPKWWDIVITPIYGTDGSVKSLLAVSRDITEQEMMEGQYSQLFKAVEQSPIGIVISNSERKIVYINPWFVKLSGYSKEEIKGKSPAVFRSGEHPSEFYKNFDATVAEGNVWHGEMCNKRKDGELYWVDLTSIPIRDEHGEITGHIEYYFDITDKKKLEKQFLQAQKLETVGRLAGGVAHDFNNMLTVINGYSEVALAELKTSDTYYTYFKEIRDAGKRAEAIARQLLAFSRKQMLKPELLNINDVLNSLKKILLKLLGEDIKLVMELNDNVSLIEADEGQLEQVVMNLSVNARDAMPSGGTLTFETGNIYLDESYVKIHRGAKKGKYVVITITDTGVGMDKDTQSKIFEPFFTTKPVGQGTGLGLSTVYGIVKQSGGNIWVYSEVNKGTTFKIYFPAVNASEKQEDEKSADHTANLKGNEKILVVEDDDLVRKIIVSALSNYKYNLFSADGGEEAAKVCSENRDIDLIICDVVMPGMDGRQVAAVLLAYCPNAKVLYMSGYTNNVIAHHHILDKDVDFIEKPFTPQMIGEKVREVLDRDKNRERI
ncbi:MAG: PAS domain S-box protein [Spirochaetales bacterium]|nr:PAS domain S-box protein [Spirochaetales bacterium]